ncbi:hypothetical protein PAXRUDRAFT_27805 [Paxillus rubicundulus Ve08.2h10]|uniref:Uncharacterized protein n=1 Tax=Paxillus rubicundulus Ve08.2h10 TaxID=930991 RepID=A0A0D0DC13_9AGAM|nr:hypothetical protein PAXRUDRAFT_27805 [Paxillus rubicundulus Ve08.2h10]
MHSNVLLDHIIPSSAKQTKVEADMKKRDNITSTLLSLEKLTPEEMVTILDLFQADIGCIDQYMLLAQNTKGTAAICQAWLMRRLAELDTTSRVVISQWRQLCWRSAFVLNRMTCSWLRKGRKPLPSNACQLFLLSGSQTGETTGRAPQPPLPFSNLLLYSGYIAFERRASTALMFD